jgi:predicted O-linked N-acetylglucosamine transferase (SPINDLY family)
MKKKAALDPQKSAAQHRGKESVARPFPKGMANTSALFAQALALQQAGRLVDAEICYKQVLAVNGKDLNALNNLGTLYLQHGRLHEGIQLIRRSLDISPGQPYIHMNLGNALRGLKRLDEALSSYDRTIALKSGIPQAYYNRGNVYSDLGRMKEALTDYDRAIGLKPDYAQACFNRGNVLKELQRFDESLASYTRAIEIKPDYVEAYQNRGLALSNLERLEEALNDCNHVLTLMPTCAEAHYNRGNALRALNRLDDALSSYDRAIRHKPDYSEAHYNRGNILQDMNRLDEALSSYDRAIAFKPADAEAYCNRGNVLHSLNRLEEALASHDHAISLNQDIAEAHKNRGNVLRSLKLYDEAVSSYERVLALDPNFPYTLGSWLYCRMNSCNWADIDVTFRGLNHAISLGQAVSEPFIFLSIPSDPLHQQQCALTYVKDRYPASKAPIWQGERYAHERIRLGYFSADYKDHPVSHLIAHLIECHDRDKFEILGFSLGQPTNDPWHKRLEASFDRFIDVSAKSDEEIATLARELEIDIAIDLNGHTKGARPGIFALRPVPIQVNYLGFPGTSGASYMDYLIADRLVVPEDHRAYYNEKVVYLQHSFMVNDSTKAISDRQINRSELGLPDDAFVFCCFNNAYKLTPDLFEVWMRLLNAVDGSVLWLSDIGATAIEHLKGEAEKHGVSPDRLVIAQRMESLEDHLKRHCQADLFLDTFYYNAHTTASDALWSGLPVLTCLGDTFAGRVAASLLTAVGMPELITRSHAEYESLALKLATKPESLAAIRQKLTLNIITQPLFDTVRFARHIEVAYLRMYERHQAGLPLDHIVV